MDEMKKVELLQEAFRFFRSIDKKPPIDKDDEKQN